MEYRMLKVAILDMYNGTKGLGLRAIREMLDRYQGVLEYQSFDVRQGETLPGLEYDIYISSGGPGDPLHGDGVWDKNYFKLVDKIFEHNKIVKGRKKYLFLICHSFQMVTHYLKLGKVSERKSKSFGTFPAHKTKAAMNEPLLKNLEDPYWIADFRFWQMIEPHEENLNKLGAKILTLEKIRPHIDLERAIMMIRFSPEIVGTQYHPEADPKGMLEHFNVEEQKQLVIKNHGEDKYNQMLRDLSHPGKIQSTHDEILPGFLNSAIEELVNHIDQAEST